MRLRPRGNPLSHALGAEGLLAGVRGRPEPAAAGSAGYVATLPREQTAGSKLRTNSQRSTLPACVKPSGKTTGGPRGAFCRATVALIMLLLAAVPEGRSDLSQPWKEVTARP